MPRSLKRGEGFCQDPSSQREKKGDSHIQTGVTNGKGESERRILPADAAEKRGNDGKMRGETDKRTIK